MTTQRTSQAPRQATVSLADIRQTYSQTRLRFTKTRGVQRITREGEIEPDFITLICLVSEIYRSYGDELEPVRQFHPSRETPYSQGHTSSVSHTKISRHITTAVSRDDATTTISEGIIIKRPRKSILEQETYALVSFITELRVRTHAPLKEHPNIAQLRGVGWDFEDEEATIPRPLLLEELAPQGSLDNFWARWNFVRLKFKSKLDLARNIAEGIRAMHDCGIVHGDIKPENILIFPRKDADNEFVAKLTDFGHSVFEYSHSQSLPAFTPQWCAPELLLDESGPNPMGFREMKLTDTYSYGLVVLSIMIGRPFHESVVYFMTRKSNGTMLKDAIELVSKEDRENNDSDLDLATIELLMRRTIQLRPKHRSLNQCIKIMNHYDKINGHKVRISAPDRAGREDIIKGLDLIEMVAVGHSTFSRTSHQLKAHIVESLLRIANDTKDPRNLAIAWELSVCYFSGFGVEISFQSASKWLLVASEAGIPAARYYVAILHEAMNIPYQVLPRQYKEHRIAMPVSEHQSKVQVTGPGSEDLGLNSSQESDYESDTEYLSKPSTHASTSKKMPTELLDIFNLGTLRDLQAYLQDKPEDINSRDFEGNTPLILAARQQKMDMLKLLLEQVDIDAGIPNHSGHTVLHFLPSFDDETVKDLVPKLAQRRADIEHEARAMPLRSEDDVLIPEIRCCSILNAILHGNLTLLECLLEAAHAQGASSQCHICECASRFRRVLAVSLSIFQARALTMLVGHVRDRGNRQDIGLKDIRVWASSKLLPLHKVPFNSVAIRALDLPDSVFRAMNYGTHYVEALEETIGFLLSTEEENVEDLAYSMITEAVESNTWEAVRFLLDEGENRQFTKSWWIRGPLDDSPFMRSISLGFREIFKLFMNRDTTLLQRRLVVTCWLPGCWHKRKIWDRYARELLGFYEPVYYLPKGERKHDFNPAQRALWLAIDSGHQDYFFTNAILDAADPESITSTENLLILEPSMRKLEELKHTVIAQDLNDSGKTSFSDLSTRRLLRDGKRLDGSDFLEHAILSSVFSPAAAIVTRFPDVFRTRSLWPYPSFWRSSQKSNIRDTSRVSIRQVLRHGSYRQCRFIMERLLPLRTRSTSRTIENRSLSREKYNSLEEGVQKWTRCPLSHEEYHQLVTGNIRTHGSARRDLWNVIETQAKLGHSRSASYLRRAILYGNHEALEEMLQRGWDPNGPFWARLYMPLRYTYRVLYYDFKELLTASDPDLPQTDWMDSRTHKAIYQAYRGWYNDLSLSEWNTRLEKSRVILRNYGGKTHTITTTFTMKKKTLRGWAFIGFFLIYTIALPLTFTYATEGTWTSTSRGQKLGFSYLWSVLSVCLPTFLLWRNRWEIQHNRTWLGGWIPVGLLIVTNYILLPILVIRVNWRPFLSCHDTITDSGSGTTCNVVTKCTDYSYLLPLAVVATELAVSAVLELAPRGIRRL